MPQTKTPQQFSDNFWSEQSKLIFKSISNSSKRKEKENHLNEFSAVDETADFYDPYSDLNLYLSKRIKQEICHCGSSKKWSVKIQEELLEKISPEFQKKFPQYRLGISALKKTWEKIIYYTQQFEQEKGALTHEGKLNTQFFIRENLKNYTSQKDTLQFHPSQFAHQLATKMSECIATINAERSKPHELAQHIWSVQRHLLISNAPQEIRSPYDEYDSTDKLIVKTILDALAKNPQLDCEQLKHQVHEILQSLSELPSFSSIDTVTANASAILAERLYSNSTFHTLFFTEQKNAVCNFIRRHSTLCKSAAPIPQLTEWVRRISALYTLACQLPKTISEAECKQAVYASYPLAQSERPKLAQSLYAFISAELVLMRNEEFCRSPSYVADAIWQAYREAVLLPPLDSEMLEIVTWKLLSETEHLLEKLPYRIGLKIQEEIANILIDNPKHNFSALVHAAVQLFKRTKDLIASKKSSDLERKIENWVVQGEMLCRWIQLPTNTPLFKLICKKFKQIHSIAEHATFVNDVCHDYLQTYPELIPYAAQLNARVWILYKYAWYTLFSKQEESSYDRFLRWHALRLREAAPQHTLQLIEEIVKKQLPLIPFSSEYAFSLLFSNEQIEA